MYVKILVIYMAPYLMDVGGNGYSVSWKLVLKNGESFLHVPWRKKMHFDVVIIIPMHVDASVSGA
jgi:hypothetical protein